MTTKFNLEQTIRNALKESLEAVMPQQPTATTVVKKATSLLKEALVVLPKSFRLKTELLSALTKENHFKLYKQYCDSYNLISAKLDTLPKSDDNPNNSDYRRYKLDETSALNAIKLHELYFNNISDLHSEISYDSIPFIRLSNFWGTFENWQFDFRGCGMASMEGWAITYWEPFKQRYLNTFIERHSENVPVFGIPVLVIDTHHHAWFRDHIGDKINYLNGMMTEINWSVVEARMTIAERCNIHQIFMIEPVGEKQELRINSLPQMVSNAPPIGKDQITESSKPNK